MSNSQDDQVIWVLVEESERDNELAQYAGFLGIRVEKLKEQLEQFSASMNDALSGVKTLAGEFELKEIKLTASISAEKGFMLVSKAGIEGGIEFTFKRE
jgi:hypothetical protein